MATEKRLIDAYALIRRICVERDEVKIKHACDVGYHNGLNMAASMTIHAPTVDAVEVVRCKDCASGKGSTHKVCPLYKQGLMKDDDFCYYGERKDDD